jgi:RNA polymerase sigma factor (sigma-70 family)
MNDDAELLRRYARDGAEDAFAELVRRHLDLTWAAARRITGDPDLARDVAQTVFADLARKARHLPPGTVLPGWLYRAACLAGRNVNRGNRRRIERERQAMNDASLQNDSAAEPAEVERLLPQLDEALAALGAADRDAVVLRFLAGKGLAEVGRALGVNEDAARKRVTRAVEKLRAWFERRGTVVTSGALLAALGVAGAQVAPAGLAATLATASLAGVGTIGILETLALMKTKLALSTLAVATVATPLTYQQISLHRLRDENRALQAQAAAAARPAVSEAELAKRAAEAAELERLRAEHLELLRLRGEVTRLRAGAARAGQLEQDLARLRAAQTASAGGARQPLAEPSPEELEAVRAMGIAKLNVLKDWGLAMHIYANENGDQFPPSLADARKFLPQREEERVLGEEALEIMLQGGIAAVRNPTSAILVREREAWPNPRGGLSRTYVFVDGHSEIHSAATLEELEAWERERMAQGQQGGSPATPGGAGPP